jgi:predicted RNase H-like HicB family nuclease
MKITSEIRRRAAAYPKSVRWSDEDGVFIGSIEGLCGDCDHGNDPVVVFRTLKRLAEETIAQWDAAGLTLPDPPSPTPKQDGAVAIRAAMGLS